MDIHQYLSSKKKIIDSALEQYFPRSREAPQIVEVMKYSVLAPGKRFRPILVLASCEVAGGKEELAVPTACAIEFIHVFSLIHDDLPAMDNADYRRGQLSSHKRFGEALAILAGDALNTLAFEIIVKQRNLATDTRLKLIEELSTAMGAGGVVGGQVLDIHFEGKEISTEVLEKIHIQKTGALIKAAVRCGAIIGGATPVELENLSAFAYHLGIAFQIIDDIMDVRGSFEKTGKTSGIDLKKRKATYPGVFGIEKSNDLAELEAAEALKHLENFGNKAESLREIVKFVLEREG